MKRTLQTNTPWLAVIWLCCGTAVTAADNPQEEQEKESVEKIIEQVIREVDDANSEPESAQEEKKEVRIRKVGGEEGGKVRVAVEVAEDGDQKAEQGVRRRVIRRTDGSGTNVEVEVIADGDAPKAAKTQQRRIIRRLDSGDGVGNGKVRVEAFVIGGDGQKGNVQKRQRIIRSVDGKPITLRVLGDKAGVHKVIPHLIKGADGENVSVNVETVVVQEGDDEPKKSVKGKIRIKGPDGKVKEIDLGEAGVEGAHRILMLDGDKLKSGNIEIGEMDFDVLRGGSAIRVRGAEHAAPQFRIGVHCEEVDGALRAHLDLPKGALIVRELVDGSPAVKAGMKQYDLLVAAGDKKIKSLEDLVARIQKSKGEPIQLRVQRRGEQTTLSVKPEKASAEQVHRAINHEAIQKWMDDSGIKLDLSKAHVDGAHDVIFQAIRPGLVIDRKVGHEELLKNLPVLIDRARGGDKEGIHYRIRKLHKEHADDDHAHEHDGDHDDDGHHDEEDDDDDDEEDELEGRMRELTREIKRLERALEEIRKRR